MLGCHILCLAFHTECISDEIISFLCYSDNDEVPSKQGAKKKKNKKKTQENNGSENQAQTDVMNPASKEQTSPKARTYGNGLIVQTVALGKPDGKKATPGKKVNIF